MSRPFTAALRRANRLMQPAKLTQATRSLHKAMTGLMIAPALAPLAALSSKTAKPRKAVKSAKTVTSRKAVKPRKATVKSSGPLGVVLQQLRAARAAMPGAVPDLPGRDAVPRIPQGAQYLSRKHRCAAGSRGYRLYLPSSRSGPPKGLILMLHGCSQTPDDFAVGTHMNGLAEKHGLAVAYPAQTRRDNLVSCWNWFKPGSQDRGAGEPAILASLTRKLMKEFGLGRDAVFVAGLSAGGAMAAVLADVYPDVFSAAGVHSGLARKAANGMLSAMVAMKSGGTPDGLAEHGAADAGPDVAQLRTRCTTEVRRIVFHGDTDGTIHPSNAGILVASALGEDATPTKVTKGSVRGRGYVRSDFAATDGTVRLELWMLLGAGHAWSGGRLAGSYTDAKGPDASAQMVRFFLSKPA